MFDKSLISVNISYDFVEVNFNLHHKVNFIIGESGEGKSYFVQAFVNAINGSGLDTVEGYNLYFIDANHISMPENVLAYNFIIVDDVKSMLYSKKFSEYQKRAVNSIFLFILRDVPYGNSVYSCFSEAVHKVCYNELEENGIIKEKFTLASINNGQEGKIC